MWPLILLTRDVTYMLVPLRALQGGVALVPLYIQETQVWLLYTYSLETLGFGWSD